MAETQCPKCGLELPSGDVQAVDCPRCGIVFSKWSGPPLTSETKANRPRWSLYLPEDRQPSGHRRTLLLLLLLAAAASWWTEEPGAQSDGAEDNRQARVVLVKKDAPSPPEGPTGRPAQSLSLEGESSASESDATETTQTAPGVTADQLRAIGEHTAWEQATDPDPARTIGDQNKEDLLTAEATQSQQRGPGESSSQAALGQTSPPDSPRGQSPLGFRPSESSLRIPNTNPRTFLGWYEEQSGYETALRERQHNGKALVVYFHAEACPWSKRFEREYLSHPSVSPWLERAVRVHLRPEQNAAALQLAKRYKVEGYPSFFVIPNKGLPVRIHPFEDGSAMSPLEFVIRAKETGTQH